MQPLYNREGRAVAYLADNESSIYLYDGGPAGWLHQGAVYAYDGRFLGWMMYGWLCDPEGHPAFFTDRAQGGPKRPPKLPRPARGSREFRPQRAQRLTRPSRPGMKTTWAAQSDESFFVVAGSPGSASPGPSSQPAAGAAIGDAPEPGPEDGLATPGDPESVEAADGGVADFEALGDPAVDTAPATQQTPERAMEPADRRED
jgi:hypothetical protein